MALVDDEDYERVSAHSWHAERATATVYARADIAGKRVRMHRFLTGAPEGLQVDHIDGNGLNNQRENLRPATRAENAHNARRSRANTSGVKGVSWAKHAGKWDARVKLHKKQHYLGLFTSIADAEAACRAFREQLHGDFVNHGEDAAALPQATEAPRAYAANTSGFRGVSRHKNTGKWQARVGLPGKKHWLGLHDTPEAAHAACEAFRARITEKE